MRFWVLLGAVSDEDLTPGSRQAGVSQAGLVAGKLILSPSTPKGGGLASGTGTCAVTQGPMRGLMLCCHRLEIVDCLEEALHFLLAWALQVIYLDSPDKGHLQTRECP